MSTKPTSIISDTPSGYLSLTKADLSPVILTAGDIKRKPKTRNECVEVLRPCPYVSCRYNNQLDIDKGSGEVRVRLAVYKPESESDTSCALDVADGDGHHSEEEIAEILGLTTTEVKQTLDSAYRKLRHFSSVTDVRDLFTQTTED